MTEPSRLRDRRGGGDERAVAPQGPRPTGSPASGTLAPVLREIDAVAFRTDGMINDSTRVYAAAWKTAFDTFLRARPPAEPRNRRLFDARDDYARHDYARFGALVDGADIVVTHQGELIEPPGEPSWRL